MIYPASATLSPCGRYRYNLVRVVRPDVAALGTAWKRVLFCKANPSTATAEVDDHTITKTIGFTLGFNIFSSLEVVNPFAYRATDPDDLMQAMAKGEDVVGPENDAHILAAARRASLVICAWGTALRTKHPAVRKRVDHVITLLHSVHKKLYALDRTKDNEPRHVLMLPYTCAPWLWKEAA